MCLSEMWEADQHPPACPPATRLQAQLRWDSHVAVPSQPPRAQAGLAPTTRLLLLTAGVRQVSVHGAPGEQAERQLSFSAVQQCTGGCCRRAVSLHQLPPAASLQAWRAQRAQRTVLRRERPAPPPWGAVARCPIQTPSETLRSLPGGCLGLLPRLQPSCACELVSL